MKNIYLIVVSLILLSTLGCASTPESRPAEDTAFFLARYDKVWDTALMVLGTESIPVESYEKKKGIITTKFVNYSVGQQAHYELDTIALKPSATRLAIWSQVGYTLTILITPINDMSTKAKVTAHIEAYDRNVTQEWHKCISKGVLENTILDKIRAQL